LSKANLPSSVVKAISAMIYLNAPTGVATTDNATLQAGLTAAAGGTLRLAAGTYNITNAMTVASDTMIVGDRSTILQINVSGTVFDLTGLSQIRFVGLQIMIASTSTTVFYGNSTFNCTFDGILIGGTHSVGSPQPGQVAFQFVNNSGDCFITNGSEITGCGIGVSISSFAIYMSDTKVSNCQYGIQSVTTGYGTGMIITNCVFASTAGGVTVTQINANTTGSYWKISNCDIEGGVNGVVVGTGALYGGPTSFVMTGCHLNAETKILDVESANACSLVGVSFTATSGYTPTTLTINSTGAPNNGFAAGLVTNVTADGGQISTSLFPSGWTYFGKTSTQITGITVPKNNYVATTDPTVSSDTTQNYSTGSTWVNTATSISYECISAASGAAVWRRLVADVQVFTTTGSSTWTKPAWATTTKVMLLAAGAGGGSGAQGPVNTARVGGGGGGGGSYSEREFQTSDLTSTVAITLGAVGTGGAAQATSATAGNNGTSAGTSQFASYLRAGGGTYGTGGGLAGTGGTAGSGGGGIINGCNGGTASITGGLGSGGVTGAYGYGGGSGGGVSAGNTDSAGAGGSGELSNGGALGGGGTASGGNGVAGTASSALNSPTPGGGGGGGAGSSVGTGGNGGAGALYGAGGGGGGASLNGNSSGAGGNGAGGICVVFSR
jgi:hypothetical protein